MTVNRALVWAIAIALPLSACGNKEEGEKPAPTASAAVSAPAPSAAPPPKASATAAPAEKPFWKAHHGGGMAWMLLQAAHGLPDLKEPQKAALDKIAEQLHNDHSGPHAEMKAYHEALAAQVKAGKIEPAKLDPLMPPIEKAQQARRDKEAEALNALHAALEPAQRKALVAAVKAKMPAKKPAEGEMAKRKVEHLTKELGLDAGQQKKVEALVTKDKTEEAAHEEMEKHRDAALTAFEGDTFDAKKLEAPAAKKGMEAHVKFLTALLPILKPEQRDKLAASMSKPHPGMPAGDHEEHDDDAPATP